MTAFDLSDDSNAPETGHGATVAPHDLAVAEPGVAVSHVADAERQRLRAELAEIGGPSSLLRYVDEPEIGIDITKAHPSSLPTFITGQSTLLSNLFRDEVALLQARRAADAITAKNVELRTVRGINAVHLAVGLATWVNDGATYTAPVLLRPLAIRRRGTAGDGPDFELKLQGGFVVNPELVTVLEEHFGIGLDGASLALLAHADGVFKPQPVIDRLRGLTAHIGSFTVRPRLVVSTFADVARGLVRDLTPGRRDPLEHRVLDALAGHPGDREALAASHAEVTVTNPDRRAPANDTLLLDADDEQEAVIAAIAAGRSFTVATLPGTGGTQTVVNAIGSLVGEHKRVLVVSPRRSTLEGIRLRLSKIGLLGLAVTAPTLQRDLIRAIGRNEKAAAPPLAEVDEALVRLRSVLLDYRGALSQQHPQLGVSPLETLRELTRICTADPTLITRTRLEAPALAAIAADREGAAQKLALAARLGEFRFGPNDSPWCGVSFATTAQAIDTHALAKRLHQRDVPLLLERGYELIGPTRMRPFQSIDELGDYLLLLRGIRDSLDRFKRSAFERPLGEMITALGPRRESANMTGPQRRRLRRLAKEYLRPGVHVADLHESLVRIQEQRTQWQRYVEVGVVPEVPLGLGDVQVAWQRVHADLEALDGALARERGTHLNALPVAELVHTLSGLAADSDVMENLQERVALRAELEAIGLDPLLTELSVRHVAEDRVAAELEFVWWQSALEVMLRGQRALLGANTSVVDRLERDFRLVDEAHAAASGQLLAWRMSEKWKIGLIDEPGEAAALKRALTRGQVTPRALMDAAPTLTRTLAPVWLASPYDVPQLPEGLEFDAVLLVDAAGMNLAEAAPAIRRAHQLVAFGDPATQRPSPFTIAVTQPEVQAAQLGQPGAAGQTQLLPILSEDPVAGAGTTQAAAAGAAIAAGAAAASPAAAGAAATPAPAAPPAFDEVSVFERLAELLPVMTLTRSYRAGGEDLAELVNDAFYGGEIVSLPWAGSYLGRGSLSVDYVEKGMGAPDPISGAVESTTAEVERIVTLVAEHAMNRPGESLMVVTASPRHAERLRHEITVKFAERPELAEFAARDSAEPFAVLTLEQSVAESRDRVIFSLGYGLTRHGRVLSDFGDLTTPDGERLLTVGMTRARRSMVIVSSIRPDALDGRTLEHGAGTLFEILATLDESAQQGDRDELADPLTRTLAQELRALGIDCTLGYRGSLTLVAKHGGKAVVAESDPEVHASSLREALRLRPQVLRRLGWHYVRVHAFDLYSDPAAVAARIAGVLGREVGPTTAVPTVELEPTTQPITTITD